MKKIIIVFFLILSLNFSFNPLYQGVFEFIELSATSRPIELQYIRGTGTQTGLTAGLYNHDSKTHRVSINRGILLKSASGGIQSMVIAYNTSLISNKLFSYNSVYAIEWKSQRSKPVYYYELPPKQLTEICINAVCAELHKNPPSQSNFVYTVKSCPYEDKLQKIYATVDTINIKIVPTILDAILSQNGNMVTLSRPFTDEEKIIFNNLDSYPEHPDKNEQCYINFNTLNWAIWAVTDSLNGEIMKQKIREWSMGLASSENIDVQMNMTKLILQKAGLVNYANRFK